jgi:hypothetical protein
MSSRSRVSSFGVFGVAPLAALMLTSVASAQTAPDPDASVAPAASSVAPPIAPAPAPAPAPPPAPAPVAGDTAAHHGEEPKKTEEHWYDKIKIRGYSQLRYNRVAHGGNAYVNEQGDKSIGDNGGFFFRRGRIIISGDVHEHLSIYLQPDVANVLSDSMTHAVALRDWYADVFLDKNKEFRFRIGQSKVPYGFENMQSSSNRLAFDRSDPLNSAVSNERDIGVFAYWVPKEIRHRFKELLDSGLKGSGDYGMVGLGVYNGQTANRKEYNDNKHVVGRITYPFKFGGQFVEVSAQGYAGYYVITRSRNKDESLKFGSETGHDSFKDYRAAASLIIYPQPLGFQAEYNIGTGPQLDPVDKMVKQKRLHGGYAMVMWKFGATAVGDIIPYVRAWNYEGGKKHETDAVGYSIKEIEAGIEWLPWKALELTAAFDYGERTNPKTFKQVTGHLVRLQAQFNY